MAQPPPGMAFPPMQPGQQPTPEQIRQMQAQLAEQAQKAGMSLPEYVERLKAQAMQQHQARMAQQQQAQQQPGEQGQQGQHQHRHAHGPHGAQPGQQQVPIQPGPPKPEAIALAKFLQSQNLKPRTCIFQEKRKDMFKVKRAIRALQSEAYTKSRKKQPLLPEVTDRASAENTFKMLPMSLLALRVSKIDQDEGHEGHNHGKKKRVKGLWTVKVEQQQEARDDFYYVWLYEGPQWKNKLYAVGALALILAVVFFPVWPYRLRMGAWYLSMAMLGVLGLFFTMAFFRLILFLVTMFTHPPGLWLYPNLFEDVGFFDSFRPVWAWHEDEKAMKRRKKTEKEKKKAKREAKATASHHGGSKESKKGNLEPANPPPDTAISTATEAPAAAPEGQVQPRNLSARVEEAEDE